MARGLLKTEKTLTKGRGRHKIKPPAPDVYLYNPDRWKSVSIDEHTIGPMGIMGLSVQEAADPRIAPLLQHGQLTRLSYPGNPLPYGAMLLRRFELSGCRGSIVVSRTYAYGDIFLAACILAALVDKYPDSEIVFHTKDVMEPLVRHTPGVTIISSDVSLQHALREAGAYLDLDDVAERQEEFGDHLENRIEIFHSYLGLTPKLLCPAYFITDEEIGTVGKYLEQFPRPYLAISPSTMRKEKSWRYSRWKELAVKLGESGTVFVFDKADMLNAVEVGAVPVIGRQFRTAGAIAYHMDLFITHDSLWSHFAAALGVPQILLASVTDGKLLSKGYSDVTVIQREWPCSPCWYRMEGCVYGHHPRCLDDVSVQEVYDAANRRI